MKLLHQRSLPGEGPARETYTLVIEARDVMDVQYSEFDAALANHCAKSGSIADKLLMLEHIARKIEERQKVSVAEVEVR